MNNVRQIYLATQQMAIDGAATGNRAIGWPGDLPHPDWIFFQEKIVPGYVRTNDFLKLLAAPGVDVPSKFPNPVGQNALKLFAIKESDAPDTIFIATRNWEGFQQPLSKTSPYGEKGFVLIRKGGDAAHYNAKQAMSASATNGGFLGRTNGIVISQ